MHKIKLLHMYPNMLDLYGDSGNVEIIKYRCGKRGIELEVSSHVIGDDTSDFSQYDIVYLGGGADLEQQILADNTTTPPLMHGWSSLRFFYSKKG